MPTTDRKLRVFLCHSSQDKPIVRELYQRLNAEGWIDPWFDEERILGGQNWDLEIQNTVRNYDVVLVCLSPAATNKEGYIQREINIALDTAEEKPEETIYIIPLRLQDGEIPQRLKRYHWINIYEPDGYRQIIKSLQTRAISLDININTIRNLLSDNEAEVLFWLARGLTNKDMAAVMELPYETVKKRVSSVYRKLGLESRTQAVAFAFVHGLV